MRPRTSARTIRVQALGLLAAGFATACAAQEGFAPPDPSSIDQAEITRVITTLAADDMLGRRAFTPSADRAATFLSAEFEAAGLEPLDGSYGFLQSFDVQSVQPTEVLVNLNGVDLQSGRAVARTTSEGFTWTTDDVQVVIVGPDADPQASLFGVLRQGGDALVLVSVQHEEAFGRLAGRFFGGPVRTTNPGVGTNVVFALADADEGASYEVTVSSTLTAEPLSNVVGVIPGRRSNEIVLFSAHYDHIGVRSGVEGDSIGNGANDDASGTTAVVALARYFAERGMPERTLVFAAFTAEEMGGYGSRHFSEQLDPDQIVAMFNIEMIGKPAVEGPNTAWITGFERSSFGEILQGSVEGTEYAFYADPYPDQNLFYRSDNATLARLGVPAHSISTTPIDVDPDYHQLSDEVGTLDLDHMTATIRAIALGAETIVTGVSTPTRVDPATVN